MDEIAIYKNIESLTLKRDKLLRKLRKLVRDYERGRVTYNDLQPTLTELRSMRRAYVRIAEVPLNVSRDIREWLVTLMEFTFMVSINDERELLERIIMLMRKNSVEGAIIKDIEEDIEEINVLSRLISETLTSMKR